MATKGRRRAARRRGPRGHGTRSLVASLPARFLARLDLLKPRLARGYGGPFNGQAARRAAVDAMFDRVPFDLVVETGTHRGTTTEYLRGLTTAPIETIEAVARFAYYSRSRLRHLPAVTVRHGDSATEIRKLAFSYYPDAACPFLYLDAHSPGRLPLRWELLEILRVR